MASPEHVWRELLKEFPDWRLVRRKRGHSRLMHPSGAFVVIGNSPSDVRALKNARAFIRRVERNLQSKEDQ